MDLRARIEGEQVRTLYRQSALALAGNVVNALIVAALLWEIHPRALLAGWALLLCLMAAARVYRRRVFLREERVTPRWTREAVLGSLTAGALWGAGGAVFLTGASPTSQLVIAFVLGGMSASASGHHRVLPARLLRVLLPRGDPAHPQAALRRGLRARGHGADGGPLRDPHGGGRAQRSSLHRSVPAPALREARARARARSRQGRPRGSRRRADLGGRASSRAAAAPRGRSRGGAPARGRRALGRGRRARFQQPAHRDAREPDLRARRAGEPFARAHRGGPPGVRARVEPRAAAPRVRAQAADGRGGDRPERRRARPQADAGAAGGSPRRAAAGDRGRGRAGEDRSVPHGAGAGEPGHQRARRDAERRRDHGADGGSRR